VAVVVLQAQAVLRARDDPGAGVVVTDMEGDLDLALAALADVHDEPLAHERIVSGPPARWR
jgi:thiamine monophosphate kinase